MSTTTNLKPFKIIFSPDGSKILLVLIDDSSPTDDKDFYALALNP